MDAQDLKGRLLLWQYNEAEGHRTSLEGLLSRSPPAPEEVLGLVRVQEEFEEVRNILDYYHLHPEQAPEHEAVEKAQEVAELLGQKERMLESYFQGSIDRFSALALQELPPEETEARIGEFRQTKGLMCHYDPASAEQLDALEQEVMRAVDGRTLGKERSSGVQIPVRKEGKNYQALRGRFESLQEEFQAFEFGEHTRKTRKELKGIIRRLNHVAVDATMNRYDFAQEAQATVMAALDEYERSESDARSGFWRRATLGVGAVTLAMLAALGTVRYVGTRSLINEMEAYRNGQTTPQQQPTGEGTEARVPPFEPLSLRTVRRAKAERPWLTYAAYFSRDGHELTLYDVTGEAPHELFRAKAIYGSIPGDKERAGDHRTQEGIFRFEKGAIGHFDPLFGEAFFNLEDKPYPGLQITGISLTERLKAWERGEDATNGAAALQNRDAVRLVDYALRHGLDRGVAIIEHSARPIYGRMAHAA